ncbi:ankyrin repeat-containing domain protein [Podospora didyma]|uniref:Ankyrin repeat-containing domain protein n=1 Tax=Podospora didyma TaxID=330526 RepID=A0AAE0P434_9PEZI|nr:ankyrin repeat-containing domain protein [Podospora didyma]
MDPISGIGVAAVCLQVLTAAGQVALSLTKLGRSYSQVPRELVLLRSQVTTTKRTLERLEPLLEGHHPAFRDEEDLEAVSLHLNACSVVITDITQHITCFDCGEGGTVLPRTRVEHLWKQDAIHISEQRLARQLSALGVYLSVGKIARDDASSYLNVSDSSVQNDGSSIFSKYFDFDEFLATSRPYSSHLRRLYSQMRKKRNSTSNTDPTASPVIVEELPALKRQPPESYSMDTSKRERRILDYYKGITPSWSRVRSGSHSQNRFSLQVINHQDLGDPRDLFHIREPLFWGLVVPDSESLILKSETPDKARDILESRNKFTALHLAASLRNCNAIRQLVACGANIHAEDESGATALHHAADFGCTACIHILVDAGARVNCAERTKVLSPLYVAARAINMEATRLLIHLGASLSATELNSGLTTLPAMVSTGRLQSVRVLIEAGADVDTNPEIMLVACACGHARIVDYLITAGAPAGVYRQDTFISTFHLAVKYPAIISLLVAAGAQPTGFATRPAYETPLHWASQDNAESVNILCQSAPELLNMPNAVGESPLIYAIRAGKTESAESLCRHGAHITTRKCWFGEGLTPWQTAVKKGDQAILDVLHPFMVDENSAGVMIENEPSVKSPSSESSVPSLTQTSSDGCVDTDCLPSPSTFNSHISWGWDSWDTVDDSCPTSEDNSAGKLLEDCIFSQAEDDAKTEAQV